MRLAAIILAGGRSTRMGRSKDSLPFAGTTLLAHTCATVAACASPVVVVARDAAQVLPELPASVMRTHDAIADRGPLLGLAAGLRWLATTGGLGPDDAAFVSACDHPFLTTAAVRAIAGALAEHDVVMPHAAGFLQPLCAVYRVRVLPAVDELVRAGIVSPRELGSLPGALRLAEPELRAIDPTLAFLRSIDTPADYDAARTQGNVPPARQ
jgi:molybdopterin-guanine dinucleotide biosynthesis protein A